VVILGRDLERLFSGLDIWLGDGKKEAGRKILLESSWAIYRALGDLFLPGAESEDFGNGTGCGRLSGPWPDPVSVGSVGATEEINEKLTGRKLDLARIECGDFETDSGAWNRLVHSPSLTRL